MGSILRKYKKEGTPSPLHDIQILSASSLEDPSIVKTQLGKVQGEVVEQGRRFTSIPFAEPPVGDLRWQSPSMHKSWEPKTLPTTAG